MSYVTLDAVSARGRWSRLTAALAVALIAAGIAAEGSTAKPVIRRCTTAHLRAWAGMVTGGAGHLLSEFALVNRGPSTCTLIGNPRIVMLDAAGKPIPTHDFNSFAGALGIVRKVLTLHRGQRAYFGVYYADQSGFGLLECPTAAALRITPPYAGSSLVFSGAGSHIKPYGGTGTPPCGTFEVTPLTRERFQ